MPDTLSPRLGWRRSDLANFPVIHVGTRAAKPFCMSLKSIAILAAICLLMGSVVLDALVITDEEQVDDFIDLLIGQVDTEQIDEALTFTDPAREPIDARVGNREVLFDEGDEVQLARMVREAARELEGQVEEVQRSIAIEGDRADVGLRVRTESGLVDAQMVLRRHGDGWLVSRARVRGPSA